MPSKTWHLILAIFGKGQNAQEAAKAKKQLKGVGNEAGKTDKKLRGTESASAGLGKAWIALGGAAAAGALIKSVISIGMEFEDLETRLVTFTGSQQAASDEIARFAEFSARTPFQLNQITEAAIGLYARGFDPTTESLQALGDMAAAQGKDITTAMQAVTQAGFGEGEMLKQFGVLMRQSGDQVSLTYKGMTQTVKKESGEIVDALLDMAKTNFAGSMERQSKTLSGSLSTLTDNLKLLALSLNEKGGVNDGLTSMVQGLTGVIQGINSLANDDTSATWWQIMNAAIRAQLGLLPDLTMTFEKYVKVTGSATGFNAELVKGIEGLDNALQEQEAAQKNANEAMEEAKEKAEELQEALDDLVDDTIRRLQNEAGVAAQRVLDIFEATSSLSGSGVGEKVEVPVVEAFSGAMDKVAVVIEGTYRDTTARWREELEDMWADLGEFISGVLMDAAMGMGDAIADAIISGDTSNLEESFAQIGQQMGGQIGTAIGSYFAGPFGAILGNILGQVIGDKIGSVLGKVIGSVLDALGLGSSERPSDIMSQFNIGPNFESAWGDLAGPLVDQVNAAIEQIEAAIGTSIELMRNMIVSVQRDGSAILEIWENGVRVFQVMFEDAQAAMERGLEMLLEAAIINAEGPLAAAFGEVLSRAVEVGLEQTIANLQTLAGISAELDAMLRPQDAVLARLAAMREEIEALNLTAEAAAPLLADVAEAERQRLEAIGQNALAQLAAMANELGVQTQFARHVQRDLLRIQFAKIKADLILAGIWEKYRGIFQDLRREALAATRNVADVADQFERLGSASFGGGGGSSLGSVVSDVLAINEIANESNFQSTADWWASVNETIQGMMKNLAGAGESLSPFQQIQRNYQELLDYLNQFVLPQDIYDQAFDSFETAWNRLVQNMKDDITTYLDGLTEDFGQGTPLDLLGSAKAEFQRVLALAMGGDVDALGQLRGLADKLLTLGADVYGTSTGSFSDLFKLVTTGLKGTLGVTFDPIVTETQAQTTALVGSLGAIETQQRTTNQKLDLLITAVGSRPSSAMLV